MTNYQATRVAIISAMHVEDNELLTVQQGMDVAASIEGYCLDACDVLPSGSCRNYNGYTVRFVSRLPRRLPA